MQREQQTVSQTLNAASPAFMRSVRNLITQTLPVSPNGQVSLPTLGNTPQFDENSAKLMKRIYEEQNFNGKPEVVSVDQFATMVADDDVFTINGKPLVLARAVSRESNLDDLMYGESHHAPRQPGWYGTGTYFKSPYYVGTEIQSAVQDVERTVASVQDDYLYRLPEYKQSSGQTEQEYLADAMSRSGAVAMASLKKDAKTNFNMTSNPINFLTWWTNSSREFFRLYGFLHADMGVVAAALGYDAIHIPQFVPGSTSEILVFNRSKLVIAEAGRKTDNYPIYANVKRSVERFTDVYRARKQQA